MERRELRAEINRVLAILLVVVVAAIVAVAITMKLKNDRKAEAASQQKADALHAEMMEIAPLIDAAKRREAGL